MKTRITELLGIEYPIIQGGMAWVAEHNLAAAVSNAGGLGIIGAASAPAEVVRDEIRKCKELTDKPFGVNVMLLNPNADEVADVIVEGVESNEKGILSISQGSDGAKGMVLACHDRDIVNPYTDNVQKTGYVTMDGQEVHKFAVRQVSLCIEDALEKAGLTIEEIDHFVLHQANIRIIEGVAKRLKADYNKFPTNLKNVGNMSSATIPVLLDELNRAGAFKKGEKIVLSGFGAGLTYGACVMNW